MPIIPVILTQHAEEAAFQWLMRNAAVGEPHYSLKDLEKLDNRVDAHLDGLRIAGERGWEVCKEALAWEEAGELFTAACLAFESDKDDYLQTVLDSCSKDPELVRGIVSALGWFPCDRVEKYIRSFLSFETPLLRRIGISASAVHRVDPGSALNAALTSDDTLLRARGLKAAGELGKKELLPFLKNSMGDKDNTCRFYAAWSAALLGDTAASGVELHRIAESGGKYSEKACITAMMRMGLPDSRARFKILSADEKSARVAAIGAGAMGDPFSIPWLLERMENPKHARVAGEAFTMITGVDIALLDLEGEWPEGFEAGPTENPEDEDVEVDPDEDLPWPDRELVKKWWEKNHKNFRTGTRYLLGQPVTPTWLQQVLIQGKQRQRAYAALQQTMNQPGKPLFNVQAPGFVQTARLIPLRK